MRSKGIYLGGAAGIFFFISKGQPNDVWAWMSSSRPVFQYMIPFETETQLTASACVHEQSHTWHKSGGKGSEFSTNV